MITVLIEIFAALFILAVLAFVLPVRVFLHAEGGTETPFAAAYRLMIYGGIFGVGGKISEYGAKYFFMIGPHAVIQIKIPHRPSKPKIRKPARAGLTMRELWSKRSWLKQGEVFLTSVRIDRFDARVRLGLGDPALTGMVFGLLAAVNGVLPERYAVTPECDFTRSTASFHADAALTFRSHRFWAQMAAMGVKMITARGKPSVHHDAAIRVQEA
jgi:hypothetical protein